MVLETLHPVLSSYFLNPAGLMALSALIPLIIFYLIKKDPEREIMPSFMFFQDEGDSESTSQALKIISRNLMLIFHILAITAFALAFADPFIEGAGSPDHSILVIDRSGSMGDLEEAKNFLGENMGEQNSVILVDETSRVVAEDVPESRARNIIEQVQPVQTETDITSGLEEARRLEGSVAVASDLDQTVDDSSPEDLIQSFRTSDRSLKLMETNRRNRHGIVGLETGETETSIDIKNFENEETNIEVESGNQSRELTIEGRTVETVSFESMEGRNTVKLPQDDFQTDNTAYYYIPEEQNAEIAFIADEENQYLGKTFELINFTSFSHHSPPLDQEVTADVYIIGETEELNSETVTGIEDEVKSGSNLVLFGEGGFSHLGFQDLPIEDLGTDVNQTVSINRPVDTSLGEMEIRDVERISGESYTPGSNAVVKSDYGDGDFLLYNVKDERFRTDFLYPVFWKEITAELTEKPSIEDSNRRTGDEIIRDSIETPGGQELSGRHEVLKTGFYETSNGPVAVNMLSEDESLRNADSYDSTRVSEGSSELPLQNHVAVLILILVLFELGYLYRIGDLR
ncbi:MAG: hypothetical protein ACI8Z7_000706 [Candidatus Nanohaloarchaea archaeon]|jgi:hypothetical protein